MALSGANSFSGVTTINAGTLSVGSLANGGSNSNPGSGSISDSNYGTGSGQNRDELLLSTNGGASAATLSVDQGWQISTTFTLSRKPKSVELEG